MATKSYEHHFSSANLPFGIGSSAPTHEKPQAATRIDDSVIFLNDLAEDGLFSGIEGLPHGVFALDTLNEFAALPREVHQQVRRALQAALEDGGLSRFPDKSVESVSKVAMHMPVRVGDFSDFSCSLDHVQNAGRIATGKIGAPPAFAHHPIGYQGRASSIVVSGTPIPRPKGHFPTAGEVVFSPSTAVDYELEFAAVMGKPLPWGEQLSAAAAEDHIFGYVLLNDWSARDIQVFEMPPLGPFIGKNFGTTISPWVITPDALSPFKTSPPSPAQPTSKHLKVDPLSTYDIQTTAEIITEDTRTVTCTSKLAELHWTLPQAIAHLVSGGCGLRTGDIVATGTISGHQTGQYGCLLESTEGGRKPIVLKDGSARSYLKDGDTVEISAVAGGEDSGVGFGCCSGRLVGSKLTPPHACKVLLQAALEVAL
ncbi:hypothetical protein B0T14DRAFT_246782 [Immersiella caudata]|uniref:Fumarylacetoacetase n=1 Tax=Immersiella caudata TaxID=314043 RepID=A0AA39WJ88_9PEZI|nr:hypothetical protein B0T14DRAFT_246782 [Immersiella caudata]